MTRRADNETRMRQPVSIARVPLVEIQPTWPLGRPGSRTRSQLSSRPPRPSTGRVVGTRVSGRRPATASIAWAWAFGAERATWARSRTTSGCAGRGGRGRGCEQGGECGEGSPRQSERRPPGVCRGVDRGHRARRSSGELRGTVARVEHREGNPEGDFLGLRFGRVLERHVGDDDVGAGRGRHVRLRLGRVRDPLAVVGEDDALDFASMDGGGGAAGGGPAAADGCGALAGDGLAARLALALSLATAAALGGGGCSRRWGLVRSAWSRLGSGWASGLGSSRWHSWAC